MQWAVQIDGVQSGPLAESEAVAWARAGRLRPHDFVWSPGMPQWVPAGQTQPFAAVFAGAPITAPATMGDDPVARALLPVGRSGWAIASGYLGLLSVLLFPAPFAIGTGIAAIFVIRKNPSKHGLGRASFGIVMGVAAIVVYAIVLPTSRW
jgi:hypothetical protein